MVGRICNIVTDKGFFFIRVEESGKKAVDYFAHRSALRGIGFDELKENMSMEFVVDPLPQRGPRAEEVRPVVEV